MKFRKKPVVIEAVQLRWDTWNEMCVHAGVGKLEDAKPEGFLPPGTQGDIGLRIPTPEGLMIASQNDWIIKGVHGELYPCKPDIFAATYEAVETDSGNPATPGKAEADPGDIPPDNTPGRDV